MHYLLQKQRYNPTQPAAVLAAPSLAELKQWLPMSSAQRLWAIDLETKGVDASDPNSEIVGIGLCDGTHSIYIGLPGISLDSLSYVRAFLVAIPRLTAFNVIFDAAFLYKFCGKEEGRWLAWEGCSYGLFKQLSGEGHRGQRYNLATAQLEILGWSDTNKTVIKEALEARGLEKADMWQLPVEILGPYCAMDAEAAFQLWEYLVSVTKEKKFDELLSFHKQEFMTMCRLLIVQQHRGIEVDSRKMRRYLKALQFRIEAAYGLFRTDADVLPIIKEYNDRVLAEHARKEPSKTNKDGSDSKRWSAWAEKHKRIVATDGFNSASPNQIRWMFYTKLGKKVLKYTKKRLPSTSKEVLPSFGEAGKKLLVYRRLVKEAGYVKKCLFKIRDGIGHPQFRWPGTLTGRPTGTGKFNWLQQPKHRGYLECMQARAGHKLVQLDFSSLEPTVLAEFSQDKALLSVYGEGAAANDIYLFSACYMGNLGDKIRTYYDPENPTLESINTAKSACKHDRGIAKTVCLAANYGAYPKKMHETLTLGGVDISLNATMKLHRDYWKLYSGVSGFRETLEDMWEANGGWIVNGMGRPICVSFQKKKDILNRFCQSTASDYLAMFVHEIYTRTEAREIPLHPWLVNFYDETIGEVEEQYAEQVADLYREALKATNERLNMGIKLKGEVLIANTLADIKVG